MPCYDAGPTPAEVEASRKATADRNHRNAVADAALCGLFKAYGEAAVLGSINYEDAGITKADLQKWWLQHQLADLEK